MRNPVPRRPRTRRLAGLALCAPLLLFGLFLIVDAVAPVDLEARSGARVVVDSRGEPLRAFADERGEWRYPVELDELSPLYLEALIAYEDRWFHYHPGVNPLALIRAAGQWIEHGRIVSGGSTLTMQVARIRYPEPSGFGAKFRQMLRALQLEWHYSKDEILEYYVNHAPFGGTVKGVEAASRSYFGYPASEITRAQAALLAVLPQAPSRYRPDKYPGRAQAQRDKVLERMVRFGLITRAQAADAKLETVEATPPRLEPVAPLFARRLAIEAPGEQLIPTFIDGDLQRRLEALARDQVRQLPQHASLAILVQELGSGKIVAYLGSAEMTDTERFGYVDMVAAERSPGSTLKPFIYGLALDAGLVHSESLLMDAPLAFGDYRPQNFARGFSGPVSVSRALQQSLNLPVVQLLERLGPGSFFARMQTAGAGLRLPPSARPSLALALGGVATRLEHLVALYGALGNAGEVIAPRLTPNDVPARKRLLSPGAAWIIRDMLSHRSEDARWQQGLAIKTGTSYGNRDAWAIGVGKHHAIGVWVGRPDNAAMIGHYGALTAVPLLRAAASVLPETGHTAHPRPAAVAQQTICWPGGQAGGEAAGELCDQARDAWILDGVIPPTLMGTRAHSPLIANPWQPLRVAADSGLRATLGCGIEAEERIVPLWPAALQSWIPEPWRTHQRIPPLDPRCRRSAGLLSEIPVQIIGLDPGARIKRHAITAGQPVLEFQVVGGQPDWYWFLNGELLPLRGAAIELPMPMPGSYRLAVSDQAGMSSTLDFTIEPQDLVIGSQAIHAAIEGPLFAEAERSIEVDISSLDDDSGRKADLIDGAIGELSVFQDTFKGNR